MILVVGALHLDVIVNAPRLPVMDETLLGHSVRYALGGKAGNQASAAARMGAKAALAGRVGSDGFGDQLLADLALTGVDCSAVLRGTGASGMSVAIVRTDGEYGAVIVSGENLKIDAQDIEIPSETRILVLQNEVPDAVNLNLARRARVAGLRVILNAAPARNLPKELLALTDLLVVNRGEAQALLDCPMPASQAAEHLAGMGPRAVIVTLGHEGLVLCEMGDLHPVAAQKVAMISAHGAGDGFIGALAAEWGRGASLLQAARFASAAAALHVSTPPDARARVGTAQVRALLAAAGSADRRVLPDQPLGL